MRKNVVLKDELVKKAGISGTLMDEIESMKVIKPYGMTDEKIPFYTDDAVEQINYILKMKDLGYSVDEIQKIIKKVGFPKNISSDTENVTSQKHLTVGELATKIGVSSRTLKHWEEKGIIEADMRSSGGFRLYSESYVYLCNLIKDLQLFGYSLEQIKEISDLFREFLKIEKDQNFYSQRITKNKLDEMDTEIKIIKERMKLLKKGIRRWEELVNKKTKEINVLRKKNEKRIKEKQLQHSAIGDSKKTEIISKETEVRSKKKKSKNEKGKK